MGAGGRGRDDIAHWRDVRSPHRVVGMQISTEGKFGLALGLIALGGAAIGSIGAGLLVMDPNNITVAWVLIYSGIVAFGIAIMGGVALAIFHFSETFPSTFGRRLTLEDAAVRLHEAMRGTVFNDVANRQTSDPQELLDGAAYYIVHNIDVFARKPPSRQAEILTKSALSTVWPMDGAKVLRARNGKAIVFVEPHVRPGDLFKLIRKTKAQPVGSKVP